MKRSSSTPATFIATPCTPAGRPNRNSARMIAKSGRRGTPLKLTTTRPVAISQMPTPEAIVDAIEVPSAAPCAPNAGNRAPAADQHHVQRDVQPDDRHPDAHAGPRVAGGAQRAGDHEVEQLPDAAHEHRPQVRQRRRADLGRRVHELQQRAGKRRSRSAPSTPTPEDDRRQERLVDDAVDLVGLVRISTKDMGIEMPVMLGSSTRWNTVTVADPNAVGGVQPAQGGGPPGFGQNAAPAANPAAAAERKSQQTVGEYPFVVEFIWKPTTLTERERIRRDREQKKAAEAEQAKMATSAEKQ